MRNAALKWEVFEPEAPTADGDDAPEAPALSLVEPPAPPTPEIDLDRLLAAARGEGRAAGFEEGVAHAEADFHAAMRVTLAEIAERMADAAIAAERARAEAARAAGRVAEALLAAVAPAFARAGLAAEIAGIAAEAVREAPKGGVEIRVAPDAAAEVEAALGDLPALVVADRTQGALHAEVRWADGLDEIDLETCIARARAALAAHLGRVKDAEEKDRAHG